MPHETIAVQLALTRSLDTFDWMSEDGGMAKNAKRGKPEPKKHPVRMLW
jgi:hypothetical protein